MINPANPNKENSWYQYNKNQSQAKELVTP
jgi:hypothetical protein